MLIPNSAMQFLPANLTAAMPIVALPDGRQIVQPHVEWFLNQLRWRWLLDSWEGGEAYRMAIYNMDMKGLPVRNMLRHKREYPAIREQTYSIQTGRPPGTDPAAQATDDDYELRRARTPVPGFLAEVVDRHLGKIYTKEVKRTGPEPIEEWWEDIDGRGTAMDQWMAETIAPLLLVLGQIDVILDHPPAPPDEEVVSRWDERRLGLEDVRASFILPENIVWWKLDDLGHYIEILIREVTDDKGILWRYWDDEIYVTYDGTGRIVPSTFQPYGMDMNGRPMDPVAIVQETSKQVGEPIEHGYGRVPIIRLFDRRRPRSKNVGLPRYEMIAEMQREYYNRDSELILSDSTQAHPLIMGPEEYCIAEGTIPLGPNWLLPMKRVMSGGSVSYQGFTVLEFPKGGADSIRANLDRLRDGVDRLAGLTKPAGARGTEGQTVSQSGVSKRLDEQVGQDLLGNISKTLQRCEEEIARLFWLVFGDGDVDEMAVEATTIQYPSQFDLQTTSELAEGIHNYQQGINTGGTSPLVEGKLHSRYVKGLLPGLDDDEYTTMDQEINGVLGENNRRAEEGRKAAMEAGLIARATDEEHEGEGDETDLEGQQEPPRRLRDQPLPAGSLG